MFWVIVSLVIISLFVIDLGLTRGRQTPLSISDALLQSGFWISISLAFGFYLYFSFEHHLLPENFTSSVMNGQEAIEQYISVYLLERLLGLDNLFVIALIFSLLNIPPAWQYRVLFYGFLIAATLRSLLLFFGVDLLGAYPWLNYVISGLLLFALIRQLAQLNRDKHRAPGRLLSKLQSFLPVTSSITQPKLILREDGKWRVSTLLVALLAIEYSDLLLASDSIPAVLSISDNPFILISASILAMASMRALYFVLANALLQLRYLKIGIIVILGFMSARSALYDVLPISTAISLLVISLSIILSVLASLWHKDRGDFPRVAFLDEITRIYEITYGGFRRIIITLIGISVLIVGIIMIVAPGPAIIVIPAGLAILATEFVWARVLLAKVKQKFIQYSKESRAFLGKKK